MCPVRFHLQKLAEWLRKLRRAGKISEFVSIFVNTANVSSPQSPLTLAACWLPSTLVLRSCCLPAISSRLASLSQFSPNRPRALASWFKSITLAVSPHPPCFALMSSVLSLRPCRLHAYVVQRSVNLAADGGRVCRPLVIADAGVPRVKEHHIKELKVGRHPMPPPTPGPHLVYPTTVVPAWPAHPLCEPAASRALSLAHGARMWYCETRVPVAFRSLPMHLGIRAEGRLPLALPLCAGWDENI